jgi:hypothetical protein
MRKHKGLILGHLLSFLGGSVAGALSLTFLEQQGTMLVMYAYGAFGHMPLANLLRKKLQ